MVPHQLGLYGYEGWRSQGVDSFGYPNPDLPLAKDYYCIPGSSHTEGFLSNGKCFCDLLNERLGDGQSLKFYNIAHSGFYLDQMAKRFTGLLQEFTHMKASS